MILAAVSGGPDSIALCEYLESRSLPYCIAHVNYHHRPTAGRDEAIVRDYATSHKRPLLILHPDLEDGNFQAAARKARYDFFLQAARYFKADTLALGHQQDDAIETWMMQKERGGLVSHYGLMEQSEYEGLKLWRPLLHRTKREIQQEMDEKHIRYGIDESNLGDEYRRNQIRHSRIETADSSQRKAWLAQMRADEDALQKRLKQAGESIQEKNRAKNPDQKQGKNKEQVHLDASALYDDPQGWLALDAFLFLFLDRHFSRGCMQDLLGKLKTGKRIRHESLYLQEIDGFIEARNVEETYVPLWIKDEAQLEVMCQNGFTYGNSRFAKSGKRIESFAPALCDFPLTLRSVQSRDTIRLRSGVFRLGRILISRKVPALLRDEYRVLVHENEVLFMDSVGCELNRYMESAPFYVVKLPA